MAWLRTLRRKVERSLRVRGAFGTLLAAMAFLRDRARALTPRERRARARDLEWDVRHGVDTRGRVSLSELQLGEEHWLHGSRYQATPFDTFEAALDAIPVDHGRFTFLDLGSGKGRCLFLAADRPFQRVVGVEISQELHQVCRANIARYRSPTQRCHRIEAHLGDATAWEIPGEPTIVYMGNPFGPDLVRRVVAAVRRSLDATRRPLYLAYYYPEHAAVVDAEPCLERFASGRGFVVWRNRETPAPAPGA